jgi:signal peptidase
MYMRVHTFFLFSLSGSMEPGSYRGDLLFLNNRQAQVSIGDICVFKIRGKDVPVVHRVIEIHQLR